jgi:hypothetical protein
MSWNKLRIIWVCGLCPSSGILNVNVWETGYLLVGEVGSLSDGPLKANLNDWTTE